MKDKKDKTSSEPKYHIDVDLSMPEVRRTSHSSHEEFWNVIMRHADEFLWPYFALVEIARGAKGLIKMEGTQTTLEPPEVTGPSSGKAIGKKQMTFSFGRLSSSYGSSLILTLYMHIDKSYWSAGPREDPNYASQHTLFSDLGVELLDHSFEGFNTCIFACKWCGSWF